MGHLIGGRLLGRVTLRSDGRSPGPEDDLRVVTKDVQLSEREIWTAEPVDFRFGSSYGRGREMHIRLTPGDDSRPSDSPGAERGRAGVVRADPRDRSAAPRAQSGENAAGASDGAAPPGAGSVSFSNGPMEISCNGPLQFDMSRQEATFRDHVDVWRIIPNSQSDLLTCELLTIHFAPKRENPANPASKEDGQEKALAGRPGAAMGPRRGGAGGARLARPKGFRPAASNWNTISGRAAISLESAVEAWMRQGSNEIHCPSLKYQPGPAGRLGQVLARGPGWFRGEKDPQPAGQLAAVAAARRVRNSRSKSRGVSRISCWSGRKARTRSFR